MGRLTILLARSVGGSGSVVSSAPATSLDGTIPSTRDLLIVDLLYLDDN